MDNNNKPRPNFLESVIPIHIQRLTFIFQKILEEQKSNPWHDWHKWFDFFEVFPNCGKQGFVGIVILRDVQFIRDLLYQQGLSDSPNEHLSGEEQAIFKISQCEDYLVNHEYKVMTDLQDHLGPCSPHFPRPFGVINIPIFTDYSSKCKESKQCPFYKTDIDTDTNAENDSSMSPMNFITKSVLFMEVIGKRSSKLINYLPGFNVNELSAICKMVILAIVQAQVSCKLTHYDLHPWNIMIKKCHEDTVFVYKLSSESVIVVPTYGYYPVIIDFGFSYSQQCEHNPLQTTLAHTEAGILPDRFDWVVDPKMFILSLGQELADVQKEAGHTSPEGIKELAETLDCLARNMFSSLKIDWKTGWDKSVDHDKSVVEKALSHMVSEVPLNKGPFRLSIIGYQCDMRSFDLWCSLITLPLMKRKKCEISVLSSAYKLFFEEFFKIESAMRFDKDACLYVLKDTLESANCLKANYFSAIQSSDPLKLCAIIGVFRRDIGEALRKWMKYANPPESLDYSIILNSIYVIVYGLENLLYNYMNELWSRKQKEEYALLPISSIHEVLAVVDINLPMTYHYNSEKTVLVMLDLPRKTSHITMLSEQQCDMLNMEKIVLRHGNIINSMKFI